MLENNVITHLLIMLGEDVYHDGTNFIDKDGNKINVDDLIPEAEQKATEASRRNDVVQIENLFVNMAQALKRRTASTDGERLRRITGSAIDTQTEMYSLYRYAVDNGIVEEEPLTEAQKQAIATTVKFNILLIRVCDKLSIKALNGEDWQTEFKAIQNIKLGPNDINEAKLAELTSMFLSEAEGDGNSEEPPPIGS